MIPEGKPIVIKLTLREQEMLQDLADQRNDPKEELGIRGQFDVTTRNSNESHYYGLIGEHAVAGILRVAIDESISLRGDKHRPDLCWRGWGVEVKVARYAPPILKFMPDLSDFGAHMAVLCYCPDRETVEVHGFMSRPQFREHHYIRDFGWGERACVDGVKLRPMSALNGVVSKEEWDASLKGYEYFTDYYEDNA